MVSVIPKVSVVIPTRNRRDLLISAINSVRRQSFQDVEIIIVDDCSEDDTGEIIKAIGNRKIRYIRHDFQRGEAAARNTGIKMAKGEFIAFLDDDDEWLPEKLALQVEQLEKNEDHVGAVYTGYFFVDLETNKILSQKTSGKRGQIYNDLFYDNIIGTPSTLLLRNNVIKKIGLFDESLPYNVDYDFFIRISKYFYFEHIPSPLVRYYVHNDMLSKDPHLLFNGLTQFYQKYSDNRGTYLSNFFMGKSYYKIGMTFFNNASSIMGRKVLLKSLQYNPFHVKTYLYFSLSFLNRKYFNKIKSVIQFVGSYKNKLFGN